MLTKKVQRIPHVLIGAAAGLCVTYVTHASPLFASVSVLAAVLPDQDQRWAPRHWPHPKPGAPCKFNEHRGPTHSLTAALLVAGGLVLLNQHLLAALAFVGWTSHLITDGISPMGVPYLWPLVKRRYRVLPKGRRLHSGSLWEYPIAAGICLLVLFLTSARTASAQQQLSPKELEAAQRAMNNRINDCAQHPGLCTTSTPYPTPTRVPPTATTVPQVAPTVEPTAELTETPTPQPCWLTDQTWGDPENNYIVFDQDGAPVPCPTDIPEETTQETPTQTPTPVVIIRQAPIQPPAPVPAARVVLQTVVVVVTPVPTETSTPVAPTPTPSLTPTAVPTSTRTPANAQLPALSPTVIPTVPTVMTVTPVQEPSVQPEEPKEPVQPVQPPMLLSFGLLAGIRVREDALPWLVLFRS